MGRIRTQDDYGTLSNDYGIEIMQGLSSTPAKHIMRIGGSQAMVAGWNFDENELYNGDIHINANKSAIYIDSGSRTVITMHTGSFDTDTTITELLGDPSFESGTTGWTLSGGVSMSISRQNIGDDAYSGDYAVTASDAAGNPNYYPSSSIQYTKTGLTMSVGDVATYQMAYKFTQKTGDYLHTMATLKLEGYDGGWSTLQTKQIGLAPNA